MLTSTNTTEISKALHLAQGKIKHAIKDSANPFYKSRYADLGSVWDAIRDAFQAHGLSVVQMPDQHDGFPVLITRLQHVSGEWMEGQMLLKPVKDDPQGMGSCITYARRYALQAVAGVCPDDDDGEAASGRPAKPVKAASVTGEVKQKMPEWSAEQRAEVAGYFTDIYRLGGATGEAEVKALREKMKWDAPADVIDAAAALKAKWEDIAANDAAGAR